MQIETLKTRAGWLLVIGRHSHSLSEAEWYWAEDGKWSAIQRNAKAFPTVAAAEHFLKLNRIWMVGGS